ncbi:AFG1-like ATPase [Serratia proteamaculans]|uniref:Cell division protein ZapE n=1 Tax=Serratia proteamaculans TaxID=28151 RepID=A0ABS0TVF4_SERPR|nr:cell division protein ZapE [Serratia proteamaculans]KAB1495337.1 cell division protein ZapE [Serratia proteamaculans]MBI6182299.1 AFG1 family ATPase [Serratia proteamaculans]RYM49762.1 cell division protein ZapE [Serratia proteamaculans]CAI0988841.1 AFG1-like ATPase [Serratia proteamaculans]CAI1027334.1 AFG1-like ATPase [Serratia proteamaculans]
MQAQSPLSRYQRLLAAGEYQADEVQMEAVTQLDHIYQALLQQTPAVSASVGGLRGKFNRWLGKSSETAQQRPAQGLYMWGGVGRGKTWLMDMFFHSLPGDRKLRLHFHRFMLRVHEELTELQGQENPLEIIADGFKAQTDVLCFDEFFVSDITDAMLLATLLQALFARGITLVATSNIPPDDLYRNGLQRARFLPAIDLINQYCDVMNVDAGIDYRLRTLTQAHLYLTPLDEQTRQTMDRMFVKLAGKEGEAAPVLQINHRPLQAIRAVDGVLAVDFHTLCEEARSQLDYIALSRLYHSVILYNVRIMGPLKENTARRFLALVDEFYERHVKLVIAAEASMFDIYQGERLKFEYQRCLSRLQEMQSEEYLKLPHLP